MQNFNDIGIPGDGWTDFPSKNLPQNFNSGNVYHYLVAMMIMTMKSMVIKTRAYEHNYRSIEVTSKPLKKGTWLLKSGFIHDPQDS